MERAVTPVMRAWCVGSLVLVALGAATAAQAQSEAAFPDVGSGGQQAQHAPPPPLQPRAPAAVRRLVSAPIAERPVTSPFAAHPWAEQPGGATLGRPAEPAADYAPPGFVREQRPRTLTLALGGVALGLPWATGLGIAAGSGFPNGSAWLFAPVIGPWAALAKRSNPCVGVDQAKSFNSKVGQCVAEPLARAMLVFDGVLQATGVVLLVFGMHSDTVLVRKTAPSRFVAVAPSPIGDHGYGLSMLGLF